MTVVLDRPVVTTRIDPFEVAEAFQHTGLKPCAGVFETPRGAACALGAVYRHRYGESIMGRIVKGINRLGLDNAYYDGFVFGFDNGKFDPGRIEEIDPKARLGYEDGQAARRIVGLE